MNENGKYRQKSSERTTSISVTLKLLQCAWCSTVEKVLTWKYLLNNLSYLTKPNLPTLTQKLGRTNKWISDSTPKNLWNKKSHFLHATKPSS